MKKLLLLIFISLFQLISQKSNGQIKTLRHFDPSNAGFIFPTGYQWIVARFEPEGAGWIDKINVKLGGTSANGSVEMAIFGHEGGTAFPQLEIPVYFWVKLNKTKEGEEWISHSPGTKPATRNTQFFIAFRNFQNGARLYAENNPAMATCKSSSGGDYYYIFTKSTANTWAIGSRKALAVEVDMDYEKKPDLYYFTDQTHEMGIDTTIGNNSIAWGDLNQDGYQDFLTRTHVYLNEGGSKFKLINELLSFSSGAGSVFIDLNNDGFLDILTLYASGDSGTWYKNLGNLKFDRIRCSGLKSVPSLSSFSVADLDKDGYPELFTGQLWGAYPEPLPNYLFKNQGDGNFTDITSKLYPNHNGMANFPDKVTCKASDQNTWLSNGNTNKRSRGSAFIDFDLDGDQDLYVSHYFLEPDEFFRNNGDGSFTNIIADKGIDKNATGSNHGTGIDFGDYNNDGYPDILLPQFSHPAFGLRYDHRNTTIYRSSGAPDFEFTDLNEGNEMIQPPSGIQFEETYAGGTWGDVNNDGLLDFYITVFYGCRYVKLYLQNPDHTFKLSTFDFGLEKLNTGEDATWVDFNNDGKLDLCSGQEGRVRLFRNTITNQNHYITLDLSTSKGNHNAIGARVVVYTNGGKITRFVSAGRGVRQQAPYRLHLGLGKHLIQKIEINWPNGEMETFSGFVPDRHYHITQGKPVDGILPESDPLTLAGNPGSAIQIRYFNESNSRVLITLHNINGQLISTMVESALETGTNIFSFSDPGLTDGVYFIRCEQNGKIYSEKWIKSGINE